MKFAYELVILFHFSSMVYPNGGSVKYVNPNNAFCETATLCSKKQNNEPFVTPLVQLGVFIEEPVPFLKEFLDGLAVLNYPHSQIDLLIHNGVEFHSKEVKEFKETFGSTYKSLILSWTNSPHGERMARTDAINQCLINKCEYLFVLDAFVHISNPDTLLHLVTGKRSILAPVVTRYDSPFSNFWGALKENGYYARSSDYLDIVNYQKRGVFDVPFVNSVFLVEGGTVAQLKDAYWLNITIDPDMSLCQFCRNNNITMYVDNTVEFGRLIDSRNFEPKRTNSELFEVISNPPEWEARNLHAGYSHVIDKETKLDEPCTDTFAFPLFTPRFCWEIIEIMETYGKWSSGEHEDERVGGYEEVPTRDIHMNQVGFEDQWLHILHTYVRPLQEKIFTGFSREETEAQVSFVARYRADEQSFLPPHFDHSTYSVNFALNRHGVDYEGGGTRFIRYNCSIRNLTQGWGIMFPGRLTHYHEGLQTTAGTRYILVSFVHPDP